MTDCAESTLEDIRGNVLEVQDLISQQINCTNGTREAIAQRFLAAYASLLEQSASIVRFVSPELSNRILRIVPEPDLASTDSDDDRNMVVEFRSDRPISKYDIWSTTNSLMALLPRQLTHWTHGGLEHLYEYHLRLIEAYLPFLTTYIEASWADESENFLAEKECACSRRLGLEALGSATDAIRQFRVSLKHHDDNEVLDKAWARVLDRLQEAHDELWIGDGNGPTTEDFINWRAGERCLF
jgi:hypothetical protein